LTINRQIFGHTRKAAANSTYPQAGELRFGRQKITIFEVQFFVGSSVVKNPACG